MLGYLSFTQNGLKVWWSYVPSTTGLSRFFYIKSQKCFNGTRFTPFYEWLPFFRKNKKYFNNFSKWKNYTDRNVLDGSSTLFDKYNYILNLMKVENYLKKLKKTCVEYKPIRKNSTSVYIFSTILILISSSQNKRMGGTFFLTKNVLMYRRKNRFNVCWNHIE